MPTSEYPAILAHRRNLARQGMRPNPAVVYLTRCKLEKAQALQAERAKVVLAAIEESQRLTAVACLPTEVMPAVSVSAGLFDGPYFLGSLLRLLWKSRKQKKRHFPNTSHFLK